MARRARTIRLPATLWRRLDRVAARSRRSGNAEVEDVLERHVRFEEWLAQGDNRDRWNEALAQAGVPQNGR